MKDFSNLRFEDYLKMFWRRKWSSLIVAGIVACVVTFVAWRLPRVYQSETTILVEAQGISEGYVKPTGSERLDDRLTLISHQIQSRALLERLIQEFRLYGYGTNKRFQLEDAISGMRRDIEVTVRSRNTFSVSYFASTPWLARDVTKRLADEVIQSQSSSQQEQAVVTDQFLDEQQRQAEKALAVQEEKLKAFKLSHLGTLPEQSAGNLAALNGLHNQLIANESALQRAQDQQVVLEQRLQDQKRLDLLSQEISSKMDGKDGSRGTVRPSARSAIQTQLNAKRGQLADLTLKYTDKFPDVIRLRREIQDLERQLSQDTGNEAGDGAGTKEGSGTAVAAVGSEGDNSAIKANLVTVKREIANRQKEHEDTLQQIRVYQDRLNLSPRVEQDLLSLTRDQESLKQNYRVLQDKKFSAQVSANLETSSKNEALKVIEEAYLPEQPVKPNRRQIALMGLLVGIGIGLGLAVVLEYFDPTLGDEDVASNVLNLPVLVSVPEIQKNGKTLKISSGRGQRLLKQA